MTRPSTGPGSRRYERYENAGEDLTSQPEKADKPEPKNQTEAEQQRQFDKDYNNLNKGLPLHRGADQETYDAVVKGQHGRNRSEAEVEAEKKRRYYSGTNNGILLEHTGTQKESRDRIREAAKAELEVE